MKLHWVRWSSLTISCWVWPVSQILICFLFLSGGNKMMKTVINWWRWRLWRYDKDNSNSHINYLDSQDPVELTGTCWLVSVGVQNFRNLLGLLGVHDALMSTHTLYLHLCKSSAGKLYTEHQLCWYVAFIFCWCLLWKCKCT